MDELQKEVMSKFWKFVNSHTDEEVCVDWIESFGVFVLCIWIDFELLEEFSDQFMDSESHYDSTLMYTCACVKVSDFMGGYGFSMQELMNSNQ